MKLPNSLKGYQVGTLLAHRWVFEKIGDFDQAKVFGGAMDWFRQLRESDIVAGAPRLF